MVVIPPLGVHPLGAFVILDSSPLPAPPVIRADAIDPLTQDFTSLVRDLDPIDAQVVEAVWRVRGSGAAVANTGSRFMDTSKLDSQAATRLESEARFALRRLVSNGDITLTSVQVDTGSDYAEIVINYTNNRTALDMKERSVRARLPEKARG